MSASDIRESASIDTEPEPVVEAGPAGAVPASRVARGAAQTLAGQLGRILLQFGGVAVLARLLSPRDYGLIAMVLLVVGVGEIFRDFGLTTAAVQAKTLTTGQRTALFWVNSAVGVALTVITLVVAPLLADLFDQPALAGMIRVTAIGFTLNGIATQYRAGLNRQMLFGRLALADLLGQAIGLAIGITSAAMGAGYWALVAQQLGQAFVALVLVVAFSRWVPHAPWRGESIRPLVRFGSHLAATQAIYYLKKNVDTLTIGLRLDARALGIYNRGYSVLMSPLAQLRAPSTTVALPVLSRLQDDHATAGAYLKRAQIAFGYTIVAGLAVCAGTAKPIVLVVLGAKWAAVTPVLALLAVAGACSTLAYVGFWVYLSRGMGSQLMRYTVVTLVIQTVCVLAGSRWGINGVAAGYTVSLAVEWPLSLWWLSRQTDIPLRDLLLGAARVTLAGIAAGIAAWLVATVTPGPPIAALITGVVAGAGTYLLAAAVVPRVRADLRDVYGIAVRMLRTRGRAPVETTS